MKKTTFIFCLWAFFAYSCQDAKQELAKKVNLNTCDDTKELVEKYANTVLPLIGGLVVDKVIPESVKNGLLCECTQPNIQPFLVENYSEKELEEMLSNSKERKKALRKAILGYGKTILKCYKDKGNKGAKWVERFLEKI